MKNKKTSLKTTTFLIFFFHIFTSFYVINTKTFQKNIKYFKIMKKIITINKVAISILKQLPYLYLSEIKTEP